MVNSTILSAISQEFAKIDPQHIAALLELHEAQASIPFIAHYRADSVGGLNEQRIAAVLDRYRELCTLWARKRHVLDTIENSGMPSAELSLKIEACLDRWELEDLFLPYRPRRRTKAMTAHERGLEPLAAVLWDQQVDAAPQELATPYVSTEKKVGSVDDALEGAVQIMSEWIAFNPTARKTLRRLIWEHGKYRSRLAPERTGQAGKYDTYHNFSENVRSIPSHRLLAIRRGVKERWLEAGITLEPDIAYAPLHEQFIINPDFKSKEILERAITTAYERIMWRTISAEVATSINEAADGEAIEIFCRNLRSLLLMPAAGGVPVIGVEPSTRPDVRLAAIGPDGAVLETASILPGAGNAQPAEAAAMLKALIEKHNPVAIVLGNGSASRATDDFVRAFLKETYDGSDRKIARIVVNESGANIYSTSKIAREELKDLDPPARCAVTIGRRFQDPLAELVKVDPRAIGVGQYQHDVDQRRLRDKLRGVVESCVNAVGVDVNAACSSRLGYVSGINRGSARRIVEHRTLHGPFTNLEALKQVPAVNDTVFQQAAGFLRLHGSTEPLDATAIHPEHYAVARQMAADLGVDIAALIGNKDLANRIEFDKYVCPAAGPLAVRAIQRELRHPGRDPRRRAEKAHFDDSVTSLDELKDGMILEGTVTNVTNFGAFVDIGVHQDGLVHVSELSISYIRDANDAVKIGEVVKVKVLNVDRERRRISLSVKQVAAPAGSEGQQQPRRPRKPRRAEKRKARPGAEQPAAPDKVERRPITPEDIQKLVNRLATR